MTAKSEEDDTEFKGSAKFDVKAGETSSVSVVLRGPGTVRNGSVSVNGTVNVGPVIDELTVTPQSVFVGSNIALKAVGRDPDESPSALTYYWSTTEGSIENPIDANATLSSATPGVATVTLTISDGDSTATTSTNVTFVGPDEDAGGDAGAPNPGPTRPNVLFIIADDLGADSTSIYPDIGGDSGARCRFPTSRRSRRTASCSTTPGRARCARRRAAPSSAANTATARA